MSVQVRARREAAAFLSTYVGAQGELLVDTTNNRVQVHDGATPGGSPAAKLSEVVTNARTSVVDAAYTALAADRTIAVTSLTGSRTITLTAASAYPTGTQLLIFDESGSCSATNTILVARTGSDTINGVPSAVISTAYGYLALESNGAGKWTVVDQTPAVSGGSATAAPSMPQGRLTLASGTSVLASSVSAATSIFYTPHVGNLVPLWNGSTFAPTVFAEVSQALSDATKSPSAAVANTIYDVFAWSDGGTFRATRGPAWSAGATSGSSAARGSGVGSTALARVNGIFVNQYAVANGPAAGFGTYLGTIATDAGGATVSVTFGSSAAGGGAANVGVWNMYHRVAAVPSVLDSNGSHTYATATFRPYDNSTASRITFVTGFAEDAIFANMQVTLACSSAASAQIGIGFDSTTSTYAGFSYSTASAPQNVPNFTAIPPQLGRHFIQALESASGNATVTFFDGAYFGLLATLRW